MSPSSFAALLLWLLAALPLLAGAPAGPAPTPAGDAPAWVAGYRVRFPLRPVGDFTNEKLITESVIARLPAAGWLRADGSDICVQSQTGELIPVSVLSHNPKGDTLIQFKRHGNDSMYWAYAGNPKGPAANGPPIPEGLTSEFRDWAGDSLASWADVVAGLKKSPVVTANAFNEMIVQNVNPGRPDNYKNFAASYRGYLRIPETDTYKLHVGAEDAAFLFIDGNRVFDQPGPHRYSIRFPTSEWIELELTAGVHPIEIHHVSGSDAIVPTCALYYKVDTGKKKQTSNFMAGEFFAHATLAEAIGIEGANGAPAATFTWGIDDTLSAPGITFHVAHFEANGRAMKDPALIQWDFGDGTKVQGRAPSHVYLASGEYMVTMTAPEQPPITQRVYMWTAPSPTSPFSLAKAVELLTTSDWVKWDTQRINSLFDFLTVSEQPNRWPLVEKIGRHLLAQKDVDLKRRVALQTELMEALAVQGRGTEALQLLDEALTAAGKLPSLRVMALLQGADIQWNYLKNYKEAAEVYEKIISEYRGLDIPAVREAAIHWGDLYTAAGDLTQAEQRYRLARTLGGERFKATGQTEAIQRGAQLRIAEQKLRSGDVRGTRLLLQKMELDFPEQKLEGMYRLLKAETDRFAGRYEEAIENYEVLLKLRQWAGFRDRAIHGLADCYFRNEAFTESLEWFDKLKESFPDYFEAQKLTAVYDTVKDRATKLAEAKKAGAAPASESFRGYVTGFEPEEKQPAGNASRITFERAFGIDGPQVGVVGLGSLFIYSKDLQNLQPGGNCWVEFWYREQMQSRDVGAWEYVLVQIIPGADASKPPSDSVQLSLTRTYGQWRKTATRLKLPMSSDAVIKLSFVNQFGTMRIDGLKVLPVTDRQLDSLRSFIEAPEVE
jgi:tetratricopeptide (TPR) repeat protein